MYNLEELNRKEKEELLNIANELGIKNAEKMDDLTLRLTIIDEQASNFASNAASTEKSGRKRSRVSIKSVDRVYTANQDKAKKVDKTMKITKDESMFADLSDDEKAMLATSPAEEAPVAEVVAEPKKRGRKPKVKEEAEEVKVEEASVPEEEEVPAPKKRGRKPKVKEEAEEEPIVEEVKEVVPEAFVPEEIFTPSESHPKTIFSTAEETAKATANSDFIILQDVPKDNSYIPAVSVFDRFDSRQQTVDDREPIYEAQPFDDFIPVAQPVRKEKPVKEKPYDFDNIIRVSGVEVVMLMRPVEARLQSTG